MVERDCEEIVGTSAQSHAVRQFIRKASMSDGPVALNGEPGVGKELVARRLHLGSSRARQPFLMIDCSLYYERELRQEVFGYDSGTSAAGIRKGLLEFASRGTCYLSHIEELTPRLQQELLVFLRTGRFRRTGAGSECRSRARLVTSTERSLSSFVEGGLFSEALYEELHRLELRIPPLRERSEDVRCVVFAMAKAYARNGRAAAPGVFTRDCLEALECFPWPRNFDDLRAELRRVFESRRSTIGPEDLSFEISSYWLGHRGDPGVRGVLEELDGYIREFRILSRLDAEFGEVLAGGDEWEL